MGKAERKIKRGSRKNPFVLQHADLEILKTALNVHMDLYPEDCDGPAFADLLAVLDGKGNPLRLMMPAHYKTMYVTLRNLHVRLETGLSSASDESMTKYVSTESLRLCTWAAERWGLTDEQLRDDLSAAFKLLSHEATP